jgi:hypothetical protein
LAKASTSSSGRSARSICFQVRVGPALTWQCRQAWLQRVAEVDLQRFDARRRIGGKVGGLEQGQGGVHGTDSWQEPSFVVARTDF